MSIQQSKVETYYPTACPHCEEPLARPNQFEERITQKQIYRRHRRIHFDWGDVPEDEEGQYLKSAPENNGGLPEDCQLDTQTFTVDISMEVVERVQVEAASKSEAKRLAEDRRNYDGEYTMDLHTDVWSSEDPSQASETYLKEMGLLADEDDDG